jgi:uncharacterized membrane protein required for colicin V production
MVTPNFSSFNRLGADLLGYAGRFSSKNRPRPTNILRNDTREDDGDGGITMGLDVALGIVILIAAIRGWLQGFVYQAIRLGGLVACFYLADPVRDRAKPYVVRYLSAVPREYLDPLLWWVAAAVSYVVLVGATTLVLKMTRRPEIPGVPPQRSRNDQFAGFLVGIAKGALIAAFLTAGIQSHGLKQLEAFPWAADQARASWAIRWDTQYHPADRIWASPPVRHLVNHIKRMGIPQTPGPDDAKATEEPVVQTARRDTAEHDSRETSAADSEAVAPPAPPESSPVSRLVTDPVLEKAVSDIKASLNEAARPR